jgi:YD repeat-containing protein
MLNSQVLQVVRQHLAQFAATDGFEEAIASIFGDDPSRVGSIVRQQWLDGDFSLIPEVRVVSDGELGSANGGYAASLDEILVSADFLARHEGDLAAVAGLLLEEIGHKLDRVLNGTLDSPGDEGAIFRLLVTGQPVSDEMLATLKAQDDRSVIVLDGNAVEVERQDFVGDAGGVVTDDTIVGTAGNDNISGMAGNDILDGGDGNDFLDPGTGNNLVIGGTGNDALYIDYSKSTDTLTVKYSTSNTIVSGQTSFREIETGIVLGGAGNDVIDFTNSPETSIDGLYGGDGDDYLNGGAGNDTNVFIGYGQNGGLYGGAGNDILIGVNTQNANLGQGEIDFLQGGSGSDKFILGDVERPYYDDGNNSTKGDKDYAIIDDFNPLEDTIQLNGSASNYRLETNLNGRTINPNIDILPSESDTFETAIYIDKPGSEPDELIAILNNVSNLTLNSPAFTYVKSNSKLQFSTNNFKVSETGASVIPVVLTRSGGSQGAVSVTVNLANGSANAPADYNNASIVANFANGETSKTVNIPVVNDVLEEGNETVSLKLSNPTGGAVLGSQNTATLIIIDDDVLIPDNAGNSLDTARDASILNGMQKFNDYLDAVDKDDYYRFELPKNSTVDFTLNGLNADANIEILNSAGVVVSSSTTTGMTAENISKTLNAGVYYVRVYRQSGQTNYNLTLTGTPIANPFQIISVTPDKASNSGQVTITIKGSQFTDTAKVSLIAADNTTETPKNVTWLDDTTLIAIFDLAGLDAGAYDLQVQDQAGTISKNDVFNVDANPQQGQLEAYLSVTPRLHPWNIGEATVTYKNNGSTDIPTPLFSLDLLSQSGLAEFLGTNVKDFTQGILSSEGGGGRGGGGTISLPADVVLKVRDTATFWGSGDIGDPSTLSPGESGTYKIYFTPFIGALGGGGGGGDVIGPEKAVGGISFSLNVVDSGPIDWSTVKDSNKPPNIPADAWDVIFQNFINAIGNTSGSYQKNLGENASYLSQLGQATQVNDVAKLIAFEIQQANNSLGGGFLAGNIDAAADTPGLSLTFARTYSKSISSRFTEGAFARGWSHNWDVSAVTNAEGNVTIEIGNILRSFEKRTDGSYRAQDGDYGVLRLESGVYRLQEKGGLVSVFLSDGRLSYVEDPNGNRITLGYAGTQLTDLTHSNGDKFTLTYDAKGHIDKLTDQFGRITTYTYDGTGQTLVSVNSPDGMTNYAYESGAAGAKAYALNQITFLDSTKAFFEYDSQGKLAKQNLTSNAESITYTYDSTGGITIQDGTGASTKIWLNDRGQIARSQDALGRSTQFRYDDNGNLTKVVAPGNTVSTFTYDRQFKSEVQRLGVFP